MTTEKVTELRPRSKPEIRTSGSGRNLIAAEAMDRILKGEDVEWERPWTFFWLIGWALTAGISTATALVLLEFVGDQAVAWMALVIMLVWLAIMAVPAFNIYTAFRDRATRWAYVMQLVKTYLQMRGPVHRIDDLERVLRFHGSSTFEALKSAAVGFATSGGFGAAALAPFAFCAHVTDWQNPFIVGAAVISACSLVVFLIKVHHHLRRQIDAVYRADGRFHGAVGASLD